MKKLFKAAIAVALVCFSSTLFAAEPISFLKGTTFGLFEDETVDNLAWGVEDADGLVLGGFNSSNYRFNIGAGAWFGSLWWSVYDTGTFFDATKKTQSVTNDVVAKDGVNTDYVNKDSSTKKTGDATAGHWEDKNGDGVQDAGEWVNPNKDLNNELYLSISNGDWGIQSYWKYYEWTSLSLGDEYDPLNPVVPTEFGKSTESEEDKSLGTSRTKTSKNSPFQGRNVFGANFNGIGASEIGDVDFYVDLKNFQVDWERYANNGSYSETYKQNGSTYTGGTYNGSNYNTIKASQKNSQNILKPSVSAEMGLSLPDLGAMSTKFILGETFTASMKFVKQESTVSLVEENFNTKTTRKMTGKGNDKVTFAWANTLTPKFVFDFDVGERLSVKASAGVSIFMRSNTNDENQTVTYIEESSTYDKINKTTTKSYYKNVFLPSGTVTQVEKEFQTQLNPTTALALVYQVKPEKFNLNMGVKWDVGKFTWTTVTKTNTSVKETTYATSTNSAGSKTVTQDEVNYIKAEGPGKDGGAEETKETSYKADYAAAPVLNLGATWFITEKASLDMAYSWGFNNLRIFNGGQGGLLGSEIKLMFSVKF